MLPEAITTHRSWFWKFSSAGSRLPNSFLRWSARTKSTANCSLADQNVRPLFLAVRCAAPQLLQAGNSAVIAIASMYGLVGQYERVAYCGAKAGMIGMVRAMALDIADGRTGTCA